ncbi:MAG TPA: formylglycine-generating enzyme family protein [Nocardioidaceae bacterium]|nr:formylglycine-generating enzyme family protein [Nocardioidaceae bacterium]
MNTACGIEMVEIPAGDVTLSDRRTQRSWTVTLSPYVIATVPLTRDRYAEAMGIDLIGRSVLPVADVSWWDTIRCCNALSTRAGLAPAYRQPDGDDDVTWDRDADGYRLPTEAEWEYACRAGTTGPRYAELDDIAWYRENSGERVHSVAGKLPNAWGMYDMLGNVWEWCWDLYDADVYGSYRVLRGGGWFDEHWSCRASVRRRSHPTFRTDDLGFRVVRNAPRSSPVGSGPLGRDHLE